MTADRVDVGALDALLAKATPGEWQSMNEYQWDSIIGDIDGPDDGEMHYESVADITSHHARSRANAALIAAMHNALPELLRIYRAWQGAAVGELVMSYACNDYFALRGDNNYPVDLSRYAGTRVRLVPDGGQGA